MRVIITGVELLDLDWSEIGVILVDDGAEAPTVEVRDYARTGHVDRDGDEFDSETFPARFGYSGDPTRADLV